MTSCREGFTHTGFAVGGLLTYSQITLGSRLGQACLDVILGQFREVAQDLLVCPTGRETTDHICDGDSHMADTRTATPLAGLDRDDVLVFHGARLTLFFAQGQRAETSPAASAFWVSLVPIPWPRNCGNSPTPKTPRCAWLGLLIGVTSHQPTTLPSVETATNCGWPRLILSRTNVRVASIGGASRNARYRRSRDTLSRTR
jgi:hypothetical protein